MADDGAFSSPRRAPLLGAADPPSSPPRQRRHRAAAGLAIVASIGDDTTAPSSRCSAATDAITRSIFPDAALVRHGCRQETVFLAIRDPSMIFVASLPDLATWSTGGFLRRRPRRRYRSPSIASTSHVTMARWSKSISAPGGSNQWPMLKIRSDVLQSDHRSRPRGHRQAGHRSDDRSAHRRQHAHHHRAGAHTTALAHPTGCTCSRHRIAAHYADGCQA